LLTGCSSRHKALQREPAPDLKFWLPELRDGTQKNDYRITIGRNQLNISGIWALRRMDDSWRGIMMNEFGLKMFDFICTAKKCELNNVVALADKWHIRKTIADDLRFILEIDCFGNKSDRNIRRSMNGDTLTITRKSKMLQRFPDGEMKMTNGKRNMTYTFKKMEPI
jgi:hypothetical protein